MQVEFFWIDGWMGYKDLIGGNNEALNDFVLREFKQAVKMYGNHPSMMLVSFGNELGGNFEQMGKWIAEVKKDDPRHYYAAGIAHNITSADDYVEYGGKIKPRIMKGRTGITRIIIPFRKPTIMTPLIKEKICRSLPMKLDSILFIHYGAKLINMTVCLLPKIWNISKTGRREWHRKSGCGTSACFRQYK